MDLPDSVYEEVALSGSVVGVGPGEPSPPNCQKKKHKLRSTVPFITLSVIKIIMEKYVRGETKK